MATRYSAQALSNAFFLTFGSPVTGRLDTDGFKFFVDHGWVLVRASGTEPLIRFYAEADSMAKVDALLAAATKIQG